MLPQIQTSLFQNPKVADNKIKNILAHSFGEKLGFVLF